MYWGNTFDPLSLNLYIYCVNNPIIFIDPSGHFTQDELAQMAIDSEYEMGVSSKHLTITASTPTRIDTSLGASNEAIADLIEAETLNIELMFGKSGGIITIDFPITGPSAKFSSPDSAAADFIAHNNPITHKKNRETGTYILEVKTENKAYYTYNESNPGKHANVIYNAVTEYIGYMYLYTRAQITNTNYPVGVPVAFVHTHPYCICHVEETFSTGDKLVSMLPGIRTTYLGTPMGNLWAYEENNPKRLVNSYMPKSSYEFQDDIIR